MAENTFAGKSRKTFDCISQLGEFTSIGKDLLESEELIDLLYKIYIPLIVQGWVSPPNESEFNIHDIGEMYLGGLYVPCCERVVLSGQVDFINDLLPDHAACAFSEHTKYADRGPTFVSVRKAKLPRGFYLPQDATPYAASVFYKDRAQRADRRRGVNDVIEGWTRYCGIKSDGTAVHAIRGDYGQNGLKASLYAAFLKLAVSALNLESDSRHLWIVRTSEDIIGGQPTPLRLGVQESHVKSLFYAREMPVTETGRKRPILHWVRAHQRRLKEGIDVDVNKHLRGVEAFEMEGFSFEITNPRKKPK